MLLRIKTGYIQTDEGGVNTQYKGNKKKDGNLCVNIYGWLIGKLTVPQQTIEKPVIKIRVAHIISVLCSPIMCLDVLGSVL
jgi:hypothetical protein